MPDPTTNDPVCSDCFASKDGTNRYRVLNGANLDPICTYCYARIRRQNRRRTWEVE